MAVKLRLVVVRSGMASQGGHGVAGRVGLRNGGLWRSRLVTFRLGAAGCGEAVKVRSATVGCGAAGCGGQVPVRSGKVRVGTAWRSRHVTVRSGLACSGKAV